MWLATLLFGLVAALWTVAVPAFRVPDEPAHLDLVLHLAEGNPYPAYDGRFVGEAIGLDSQRHLIDSNARWPRFDAADAPPRTGRPDVDDLGGLAPDAEARAPDDRRAGYPYVYNQMPQHPPLYYQAMAAVLRAERWFLPGDDRPSLDRELGLLRLTNVLLVAPLPLLAWATVVRLTGGAASEAASRAGVVAALLPLGLPQLTHVAAGLNNDNLLILLGGVLCVLLAGVARADRSRRTDLAVGVALGLALLTKAFALMFVPWVVAAYALGAWTARHRAEPTPAVRTAGLGLAVAGGVAGLVGAWWWIGNVARHGEPAPTIETLTRTAEQRPPGFSADAVGFAGRFVTSLVGRTWAWAGYRVPKFTLPAAAVALLVAGVAVAVVVAIRRASPGPDTSAVGAAGRRWDVALAWLPTLLVALFVARRAWGLYVTTGHMAFVQGRYLFGAIAGPMAVVAVGTAHALGRRAVGVTLAVVVVLQVWVLGLVVSGSWSGDGALGPVAGALAWSPWPSLPVLAVFAAAVATVGVLAWAAATGSRGTDRARLS